MDLISTFPSYIQPNGTFDLIFGGDPAKPAYVSGSAIKNLAWYFLIPLGFEVFKYPVISNVSPQGTVVSGSGSVGTVAVKVVGNVVTMTASGTINDKSSFVPPAFKIGLRATGDVGSFGNFVSQPNPAYSFNAVINVVCTTTGDEVNWASVNIKNLPTMLFDGFSWAEQLCFDGVGNLFVSEAVRGELWRISLCQDGAAYCGEIYVSNGITQFGGLAITLDGKTLYAGVTLPDDSHAIITTTTSGRKEEWDLFAVTKHQPNGLACDFQANICYYTDEGVSDVNGGSVTAVDMVTREQSVLKDHIAGADGAWYDDDAKKLFIGLLTSKKVLVFDTATTPATFIGEFVGLNKSFNALHLIDDIALLSGTSANLGSTMVFGTDWTGFAVRLFSLDGGNVSAVAPPAGVELFEPTSVRWGRGPGFDPSSIYVSEGGGATALQTNRRIVQIKMK